MPMESDIEVLLSCYLADRDRSPPRRRERKAVDPTTVVIEAAEGAADTPTQPPAVRDVVGVDDYIITCNFHDDVVIPAAGAHQPSLNDTADVCRINHQDPERISSDERKRSRNITTSPSRSNPLDGLSMDYRAGQEVRPSRRSHGNKDMVPSGSTHYEQVYYPDEVSSFRTRLGDTQRGDPSVTGRQTYKKQKVTLDYDVDKSTYEYLSAKDVSDNSGVYYPRQDTLNWYVPEKGLKSHSGFEHPLHSLSRCCDKMVPNRSSALKSLVDGMAAEMTRHSEKMHLEYLNNRRFGFQSEAGEEAGDARQEQVTPAWHQPFDVIRPSGAAAVDTVKVKANHIFSSDPGGTVTARQQQERPNGDGNSYDWEKRAELVYGDSGSAELSRGNYFIADSYGVLSVQQEEGETVQDSGPSSDQVKTGPEKPDESHTDEQIRRILSRRRKILDTDSPSPKSGFHHQTHTSGYCLSHRTNPPFLQHAIQSTNPSSLQTRKAKLWHPLREEHETINSVHTSGRDSQLPGKRFSSLLNDSTRCNSVHQPYEQQGFGVFSETEEATAVTDSAPGSTLSDFRALVEAFDSEEPVSEETVSDPVYGTCQDTFTSATKSELSLHKPRPNSQQLTYTCSLCGRDNLSRKTIRRHEARNYTCSKCNKKFCLQELLLKHKKFKLCSQEGRTQMTDIACV